MRVRDIAIWLVAVFVFAMAGGDAHAVTLVPGGPSNTLSSGNSYIYNGIFAAGAFDISDQFVIQGPAGLKTSTKLTVLNKDGEDGFGIRNLKVSWLDTFDSSVVSNVITDKNGKTISSTPLVLFLTGHTYLLTVSGKTLADGGDYFLKVTATPLPPALILFGTALAGLTWLGRRRRLVSAP